MRHRNIFFLSIASFCSARLGSAFLFLYLFPTLRIFRTLYLYLQLSTRITLHKATVTINCVRFLVLFVHLDVLVVFVCVFFSSLFIRPKNKHELNVGIGTTVIVSGWIVEFVVENIHVYLAFCLFHRNETVLVIQNFDIYAAIVMCACVVMLPRPRVNIYPTFE